MTGLSAENGAKAIATIVQFPSAVNRVAEKVASVPLGPWGIDVTCSYDSGCKKEHYSMEERFSSGVLTDALHQAENHAKTFFTDFKPVMTWLKTTLPSFSKTFSSTAQSILKVLKEVSGKDPTSAQRQQLEKDFITILDGLNASQKELGDGVTAMAQYVKDQTALNSNISQVKNDLVHEVHAALSRMLEEADGQHCGQSDAKRQFDVNEKEFGEAVAVYNTEFSTLAGATKNANDAVASLIGIVSDFIAQLKKIIKDVTTVQGGDLPAFMKQVELMASTQLWSNLAKDSESQFHANEAEYIKVMSYIGVLVKHNHK